MEELEQIFINKPEFSEKLDKNHFFLRQQFEKSKSLLSKEVSDSNFNNAFNCFLNIFSFIPLMTIEINIPQLVRARVNEKDKLFSKKSELTYNWDNKNSIKLGRFNREAEPLFYAALPVDNSEVNYLLTSVLECCKELINTERPQEIYDFTIGGWAVERPFSVINFCFERKHLQFNKSLEKSVDEYFKVLGKYLSEKSFLFIKDFFNFYSELSSQLSLDGESYQVLTALFVALRYYYKTVKKNPIHGMIYPSAMTESKGLNVVLNRYTADNFLKLDKVVVYRFIFDELSRTCSADKCSDIIEVDGEGFQITNFIPIAG